MFGIADAMKRDLAAIDQKAARKSLRSAGLTDYQINMLAEAVRSNFMAKNQNSRNAVWIPKMRLASEWQFSGDMKQEMECIRNLEKRGFIFVSPENDSYWWLTKKGFSAVVSLRGDKEPTKTANLPAVQNQAPIEEKLDISLNRDGLMLTASKLIWGLFNQDKVKDFRFKQMVDSVQAGQEQLEQAVHLIATAEQRVARQLAEQGPPKVSQSAWTEEQQRYQNDMYWLTGQSCFWLNPAGLLADPTPAPEWWTPPVYHSATQARIEQDRQDDVVARSLLAPPSDVPAGFRKATQEEIEEKNRHKVLDELLASLEELSTEEDSYEEWLERYDVKQHRFVRERVKTGRRANQVNQTNHQLYMVEFNSTVRGFETKEEAQRWLESQQAKARSPESAKTKAEIHRRKADSQKLERARLNKIQETQRKKMEIIEKEREQAQRYIEDIRRFTGIR